ncbi:MAG: glycosyltransferase family 39 protein [Nanoarchaeota archaeon]|nr:glycosyltransferase family 39 protein [Nanoarchaeota archaeon]
MKKLHPMFWVTIIFLISVSIRLILTMQSNYFSDDSSYFTLRQVEHISNTGRPLIDDELSYSGRRFIFLPFYHYILAFFSIFLPSWLVGKIISNILAASIIFSVYLISYQVTKSRKASLFAAVISAFTPIYLSNTINSLNVNSLALPTTFFFLYHYLMLTKKTNSINFILAFLFVLIFSTSLSSFLIVGLILYSLLCYAEKIKIDKKETELILFSVFFFLWTNFIIYKNAFQSQGISIIWQNIPQFLFEKYFVHISLFEAILGIGLVPLVLGTWTIFNYLFKKKSQSTYLLISLCISGFILSWFRLINFTDALMYLSILLALLSSIIIRDSLLLIRKTKFAKQEKLFLIMLFFLILLTGIIPSIQFSYDTIKDSPTETDVNAFTWLKNNTKEDSIILATIEEGHYISYFGDRKNVLDSNFLLISNIDLRINDTEEIYTTPYKINALTLLEKYDVDYIIFSQHAEKEYNITGISYAMDDCFSKVYSKTLDIFKVKCSLEKNERK